tara:strand:+ start:413 stop:808 length:396 start_codon:yes stop_codon:yes gene_type:complete
MKKGEIYGILNTFFGAGLSSAVTGTLATYFDPLIAAVIWSYPLTMLFPVLEMNKSGMSNKKISTYLTTQTYTMVLLLVWLYATSHFIGQVKQGDSLTPALIKGSATWLVAGVIYFIVASYIRRKFGGDKQK